MKNRPRVDWLITQMRVVGGVERYAYWLVCELARRGWDIRVITIIGDTQLSSKLKNQDISVLSLSAKSKFDFLVFFRLEKILRERNPDILHTHLYHAGILGRLVGKKIGIPFVLCHQGGPEENRSTLRSMLDSITSKLVDRYIVPCGAVESILNQRERIPLQKIDRIPNAIQIPIERIYEVDRRKYFQKPLRLVTIGRLVFEKAQSVMVDAVELLAMRNIDVSLHIIGDGQLRSVLERRIIHLNLNNKVLLLGFQENPFQWLVQSDIFVLTSLWESLSLALMEAMAVGLPVVATATGGTPELISHLENGYLIPPNSPLALADAVEFLYRHPELAYQMGQKARQHILENYTIPKVADQLEKYYLTLLEEKNGQ